MTHLNSLPGPARNVQFNCTYSNKNSPLSEEEYLFHTNKWCKENSEKSRETLILSHLPLVKNMANKHKIDNSKDLEDIYQAGCAGLVKAVDNFKLSKKARLSTYAKLWIRSYINQFKISNWSQVKICTTELERNLYYNFVKAKTIVGVKDDIRLSDKDSKKIANELNVNQKDILKFNKRFQKDISIFEVSEDKLRADSSIDTNFDIEENLFNNQKENFHKKIIKEGFKILNNKERDILCLRYLNEDKSKRDDISVKYKISAERVRQIEVAAKQKLLKFFNKKKISNIF